MRIPSWRASDLGAASAVDTQGSQVRVFDIQAIIASLAHFGAGIANHGAGKGWLPFETGTLTTCHVFRSINILD